MTNFFSATAFQIETFVCGPLQTNAYLLLDRAANEFVVVDPSIQSDEALHLAQQWRQEGFSLKAIWNTHGHFDHIYDNARWKQEFDAPIFAHRADDFFLEHLQEQSLWFGLPAPEVVAPDHSLAAGDILSIGQHRATVMELPGHSPGSVGFHFDDFIVSGDVLFAGSIGRYDLPRCSATQLAVSLRTLFDLPPQTQVLSGHGPQSTIETEKRDNVVALELLKEN